MKKCFICEGNSLLYCTWKNFEYVKCTNCGLTFLNKMPTEQEIYGAYEGGKLKSLRRRLVAPFRSLERFPEYERRVLDFEIKLKEALTYLSKSSNKKVLDIGCNKGYFLVAAINNGFEAFGVELIPELTIQFKRRYKQFAKNIYSENISDMSQHFKEGEFAMITAFDVVEHLRNPREDFKQIYRILQPAGIFFLQTPNIDSEESKLEKEKWSAIKALEHYQLFNERNLTQFAKQIGFSKIDFLNSKLSVEGNMLAVLTK